MKETMREVRSEGSAVGQLGLPVQVAPIDRTPSGVALASGSGVAASIWGGWTQPDLMDEFDTSDLVF